MWATNSPAPIQSPPPNTPLSTKSIPSSQRIPTAVNATHTRRPENVGGLGQAIILSATVLSGPQQTTTNKSPPGSILTSTTTTSQQAKQKVKRKVEQEPKKKKEDTGKGKEISGSDILWAMQKASARKAQIGTTNNKRKLQQQQQRRNLNTNANRIVDYDKVRPLSVKSDWATRLDDLQKRLQDFSGF